MIDCMNDEQDSSEDEKILFFGSFCFHYLAIAAAAATTAAGCIFCLTVWQFGRLGVWEFRTNSRKKKKKGIEQASLGIGFLSFLSLLSFYYRLSLLSFSLLFLSCMYTTC